jgi:fatty acid-binding protein DegV
MGKMEKVIENYVNDILITYSDFDRRRVFITHTPIEREIVDIVKQQLDGVFDEIYETNAGATIASHCGAGTLGILFMASKPVK